MLRKKLPVIHQIVSIISLIVCASLVLISCKDDSKCNTALKTISNINAEAFGKLPYTGTDTLYFLNKNKDTNIVVGQGKIAYYEESNQNITPDCFNVLLSQAFKINFTPIKGNLSFEVYQKANGKNIVLKEVRFPVNYYIDYLKVGEQYYLNYDTVVINNEIYTNVSKASARSINLDIYDESYTCYYNQPHGVLQISSTKENESYTILKKP